MKDSNLNSESLIKKSKLKYFDLKVDDNYVPLESVYDFYIRSKQLAKGAFFKGSNLKHYDLVHLGAFGDYLSRLPTLYSILYQFVLYKSIYQTNLNCNLDIYGDTAKFSFSCSDKFSAGRKIGESIFMAVLLQLFRRYTCENWEPDEIHLPYSALGDIMDLFPNKECTVISNQTSFAIIFPRDILYRASHVFIRFSNQTFPSFPDRSVSYTIERVLRSYKSGYIPSLSDLASHFSTSESSIKRSLQSEDTSFSKILEKNLFEKSVKLLADTNLSIMLISESLGYSDSPNFIRSFKKWSGVTPGIFRDSCEMTYDDNAQIAKIA
ncbi:helix-turn-helix domain-containing protein [Flavobacteriaceae bacterium R33]|uniref:Helix-turn-helix domain-containing protein n=1 Tax=Poritiphilus flavus TaxID=2697053 RepID=A0A6L9ED19_9FLAO|nr:helix-turn-helix domain-containing protein [Poritiphilus flavus]